MPASSFTVASTHEAFSARPSVGTRTFAKRADEVPNARRFVRAILAGHPAVDDAELLTCELVTNALQHAHDAEAITVYIMRRGSVVHVDVIDDGTKGLPHWREANGLDEGGRGFHLVNMIAHRWGFLREQSGTCVWFELSPDCPLGTCRRVLLEPRFTGSAPRHRRSDRA